MTSAAVVIGEVLNLWGCLVGVVVCVVVASVVVACVVVSEIRLFKPAIIMLFSVLVPSKLMGLYSLAVIHLDRYCDYLA